MTYASGKFVSAAFAIALLMGGGSGVAEVARPLRRTGLGKHLVIPSLIAAVINLPLYSYALGHLPTGVSSILFATTPLFALPVGFCLGERFGKSTYAGTLIAFGGVAAVIQTSGG